MKALHRIFTSAAPPSLPAQFLSEHLTGRSLCCSSYDRPFDVRFLCMARMPFPPLVAVRFRPPSHDAGCDIQMCASPEPIMLRPSCTYCCSPCSGILLPFSNLILSVSERTSLVNFGLWAMAFSGFYWLADLSLPRCPRLFWHHI